MIIPFKKIKTDIQTNLKNLTEDGFRRIFEQIDQLGVKKSVDRMGIDKFINQCAYLAAGSGVISGAGGLVTMLAGIPLDMINLITQQFRVTLAITYYNRGDYKIDFHQFIGIVASSLKVDAGITLTKTMMEGIAEKLLINLGAKTAERLVPVVGAAIGGTANYLFIKRMARSVKELHQPAVVISIE